VRGGGRTLDTAPSPANAELHAWCLRWLWSTLALAVRERGISSAQAAAFDQTMRKLLRLSERKARGSLPHRHLGAVAAETRAA
jgi:hypothetical protein